jgi:magnesium transporter
MKAKLIRKGRKQGQAPGVMESPAGALPPQVHVFAFDADNIEEVHGPDMSAIAALRKKWPMIWVSVTGLGDASLIAAMGSMFNLHPLSLEDVLHTPQRPKLDEFDESIYVTLRMLEYEGDQIAMDQLSLFWGDGFVLSIQERPGDGFGPIRDRLRKGGRRVKMVRSGYMAYAIIDAVIDGYFPALEN